MTTAGLSTATAADRMHRPAGPLAELDDIGVGPHLAHPQHGQGWREIRAADQLDYPSATDAQHIHQLGEADHRRRRVHRDTVPICTAVPFGHCIIRTLYGWLRGLRRDDSIPTPTNSAIPTAGITDQKGTTQ